jgi:GNAT superfamily N-acetyltransferase
MAGFILEIDGAAEHQNEQLQGVDDLSEQLEYAVDYMNDELRENLGFPVRIEVDNDKRYLLVHSPKWRERYGTFQFRFKIVDDEHMYIDQLYVPKPLRHKGIGRACCETVIGLCEQLGKNRIYLWSVKESEIFWEKLEFELAHSQTWNTIMEYIHRK